MAKKMMLVDASQLDVRNTAKHYTLLDQNISDILERRDISDADKLRLYQSALNRFLLNRQKIEGEVNESVKASISNSIDNSHGLDNEQLLQTLRTALATPKAESTAATATSTVTSASPAAAAAPAGQPAAQPSPKPRGRSRPAKPSSNKRADSPLSKRRREKKRLSDIWITSY
jgi:hypothetical protein